MTHIDSIILGLVQGLTEFIPVSSSGHLIIARDVFGITDSGGLAFDAVLQLATTFAVIVYFRRDIASLVKNAFSWIFGREVSQESKTLIASLAAGTIPAVLLGIFLEDYMETIFRDIRLVALTLVLGAIVFVLAEMFAAKIVEKRLLTAKKGLAIGLFQSLALIPGMSRSGMTISGGLFLGLTREFAARFSFLLALPILLGSGGKKLIELASGGALSGAAGAELLIGSAVAFASGLLAIHFLIRFLANHSLRAFAWYRILLALVILFALV